jgi:multidrug efflux pump subunit AcrA (membrane-fusion protein)
MAIEPGMLVVAESGNRVLEAQVTTVGRVVDAASQTVLVRAGVDNSDLALRVGQFIPARVLEKIDQGTAALAVPNAAVVRADGDVFVFVAANGEVSAWPVEIIAEGSINTYIRGGVDADSQIAVAGVAALKSVWVSAADGSE